MTHSVNGDLKCWRGPQSPVQILYSRLMLEQIRLAVVDAYFLVRGGWKRDTVKIGDKITVEGCALAKDPRNAWAGALPTTVLIPANSSQKLPTR